MVQIQQQLHSCPSFSSSLLASIRSRFAGPNPAWPPVAHLITSPHGSRSSTENRGFSVDLLKPFGMQHLRWSVSVQRTPWSHVPHFALPSFRTVLYLTVSAYFTTSAPPGLKYRCAPLVWTPSVLRPCSELGAMATSYPVQLKTSAGSKRPAKSQRLFLLTDIWCPVLCSSALKTAKNSPFSIHLFMRSIQSIACPLPGSPLWASSVCIGWHPWGDFNLPLPVRFGATNSTVTA